MKALKSIHIGLVFLFVLQVSVVWAESAPTHNQVKSALKKAVMFYTEQAGIQGGYHWRYSADLSKREGEGKVGETTAWIQPPATPSIGETLLDLCEMTGDQFYFDKAKQTAMALVNGQLHSGGWANKLEFDPERRKALAFRVDGKPSRKARDVTTLDDDMTQSVLRFLIRFDQITNFKNEKVHEAVEYGMDSLLKAQFPNGGWPHVYRGPTDPSRYPVKAASYRDDDNHTRIKEHWRLYTINDNLMSDVIDTVCWLRKRMMMSGIGILPKKRAIF
jgi:hypothetical protein